MKKLSLVCLVCSVFLFSCISNKKIVYLQDKTAKKPHEALVDHSFDQSYSDYLLESNDILSVQINHIQLASKNIQTVETETEGLRAPTHTYLHGFRIDEEGHVDLPVIGKVKVAGLTILQASALIQNTANKYYADPVIKIFLINYNVTVLGEVNSPGTFNIMDNKINILEAIGLAKDAGDYANRSEVKVLRTRGGKNHIYWVDLTDEKLLESEAFFLHPDDVVMIKPLKRKKFSGNDSSAVYRGFSILLGVLTLSITLVRTFD